MKQLMMLLCGIGITLFSFAQPKLKGNVREYTTRGKVSDRNVVVVAPVYRYAPVRSFGYGMGYGYNRFGYSPFGDPFYNRSSNYTKLPTRLSLKIEEIENDYAYHISNVRKDKTVPRNKRQQKIRELKHEKKAAVIEAKRNFIK